MKRGAALLLSLAMLWLCAGCGNESNDNTGAGHSFSYTLVGNPDTLDPQLAVNASAKTVLANLFEGLLTLEPDGSLGSGVAESYTISDDGLHYSFQLRQNSYWYQAIGEAAAFDEDARVFVTAEDFVYAFERLFDPKYDSPYAEEFFCIKNGEKAAEGDVPVSEIGVYAASVDKLEFTLEYPNSGFLTLLTSTAALPCNARYFENAKGRYGLDENSIIGNGSFAMQRWLYDPYGKYNVIQMVRNPLNHKENRVYPADLRFYIEETDLDAEKIFTDGSVDCYVSTQNHLIGRADYHAESAFSLTLGLIVDPDSQFAEPHVLSAMNHALDRFQLSIQGDDIQAAAGILPPAVTLLNKSCRELIADAAYQEYDLAEADRLVHKGMRKLNVPELETAKVLCCAGMMDYSVLRQVLGVWEKELDLHFIIEEVFEHEYETRLAQQDYTLALYAVGGENSTAASVFSQFLADPVLHCTEERVIRRIIEEAAAAPNLTDCVALYRQAEETLLSDQCFIPLFYKRRYLICKDGVDGVRFNPFSGQVQFAEAKYYS